mmetsp:Transcript_15864/g.37465  ORF Transcript_15864/g.37465 Transcript_15864/m.37465 type:complete len:419 (-) Transcript_15864:15-1271(-)
MDGLGAFWSWTCCGKATDTAPRVDFLDEEPVVCQETALRSGVLGRPVVALPSDKVACYAADVIEPSWPLSTVSTAPDLRSDYTDAVTEPLISEPWIGEGSFLSLRESSKTEDMASESPSTKCSEVGDDVSMGFSSSPGASPCTIDEGPPSGAESVASVCSGVSLRKHGIRSEGDVPATPFIGVAFKSEEGTSSAQSSKASPSLTADSSKAVIIVDWDDTLCPTTWAMNLVESAKAEEDLAELEEAFSEQLEQHCVAVVKFLRAARAVAHVAIVTLASEDFFEQSAETFLEDVRVKELFTELGIKVHFAKRSGVAGSNPDVAAKMEAMKQSLSDAYPSSRLGHTARWNVLSVGDSEIEMKAIKQVLASRWRRPLCKTVKFDSRPSLSTLTEQLQKLTPQLPAMVGCSTSFDTSSWRGLA